MNTLLWRVLVGALVLLAAALLLLIWRWYTVEGFATRRFAPLGLTKPSGRQPW